MRSPDSYIQIYSNSRDEIVEIVNVPKYDKQEYDIFDDKDFNRFINDIERIVRSSFEYRSMITYMRENLEMDKCSFYDNVNNAESFKIKIELHHEPLTLHDISRIVFNKRNTYGESLEIEMVSKEVMYVHYLNIVGLIPLAQTVHELVHNNYLFIPSDMVYGNYQIFVNEYRDFMEPDQIDILERIEDATKIYNHNSNIEVLDKKHIYIDVTGAYSIPQTNDIKDMLEERIKIIRESSTPKSNEYNKYDNNPIDLECPFTIDKEDFN